jgi:hypothetical protein
MGKKVKKHSSEFKFKVVLESYLKDNVAEVSRQYGINANQLSEIASDGVILLAFVNLPLRTRLPGSVGVGDLP